MGKHAEEQAERRKLHKSLGLCVLCNLPIAETDTDPPRKLTLCNRHLINARETMRRCRKSRIRRKNAASYRLKKQKRNK